MSLIPATSSIARAAPPAITPVPSEACTKLADHIVRYGCPLNRYGNHTLLSLFDTLANCFGNLFGFSKTISDIATAITYDYQGREAESTATFNNLSGTIYVDNAISQIRFVFVNALQRFSPLPLRKSNQLREPHRREP
jgi:hypothetical protein